jgi:secreted trypsin-like serine protease
MAGMCGRAALATAITAGTLAALSAAPAAAIVGGDPAPAGRWPWIVAILDADNSDPFMAQYCGGTVIAPDRVLTAGHCVLDKQARDVVVLIGATRLSAHDGRRVGVRAISVFPGYAGHRQRGLDAAVLELSAPAGVAPVALAAPGEEGLWPPATPAWTMGWGRLTAQRSPGDSEYYADRLRELSLPIVSDDACENAYGGGSAELPYRPAWTVCAGTGQAGTGSCYGDSGGPLVVGAPGGWLQVGILTGGDSCASPGYYDLYARTDRIAAFALAPHPAEQPDPVARPSVVGRFALGARVRCAPGRWRGSPPRLSVRWVRLDGRARHTIDAGASHRLSARDLRHRLTCVVTARSRGGRNTVAAPFRRVAEPS